MGQRGNNSIFSRICPRELLCFCTKSLCLSLLPGETGEKPWTNLARRSLHRREDRILSLSGLSRPDRVLLGPGNPPVTRPGSARPCGPGARGSPSSPASAGSSAAGRVGNFSSKINWCRNASYFPRNNATQLAGDVFICSRKRPLAARRVSLCPCARGAKEENKTKTTNYPPKKQRKKNF